MWLISVLEQPTTHIFLLNSWSKQKEGSTDQLETAETHSSASEQQRGHCPRHLSTIQPDRPDAADLCPVKGKSNERNLNQLVEQWETKDCGAHIFTEICLHHNIPDEAIALDFYGTKRGGLGVYVIDAWCSSSAKLACEASWWKNTSITWTLAVSLTLADAESTILALQITFNASDTQMLFEKRQLLLRVMNVQHVWIDKSSKYASIHMCLSLQHLWINCSYP